jgi:pimeloyl-ACP methyl ester carboxylesterase
LAYDMWGHGDTAVPSDLRYKPQALAEQLDNLLDVLGIRGQVHLVREGGGGGDGGREGKRGRVCV